MNHPLCDGCDAKPWCSRNGCLKQARRVWLGDFIDTAPAALTAAKPKAAPVESDAWAWIQPPNLFRGACIAGLVVVLFFAAVFAIASFFTH